MAAEDTDVLTLVEAYRAINIPSSADAGTGSHDSRLEQVVTALSDWLDDEIGPVVNRTVTEYHDGGEVWIKPRNTPVSTVTTLKEWDGTTTTTLTADSFGTSNTDGYRLSHPDDYAHSYVIYRMSSGGRASFATGPPDNIELVYEAGRAADTESVGRRIKEAASSILRRAWDREAAAWARAPDPFEEGQVTSRFFDAYRYVLQEQLKHEMRIV